MFTGRSADDIDCLRRVIRSNSILPEDLIGARRAINTGIGEIPSIYRDSTRRLLGGSRLSEDLDLGGKGIDWLLRK